MITGTPPLNALTGQTVTIRSGHFFGVTDLGLRVRRQKNGQLTEL